MKSQGKAQPDAARSLTHPEERMLIPEIAARNERLQRARKAGVPEVGLFFTAKERQKKHRRGVVQRWKITKSKVVYFGGLAKHALPVFCRSTILLTTDHGQLTTDSGLPQSKL
jgi:hypothetical protein